MNGYLSRIAIVGLVVCTVIHAAQADVVTDWNDIMLNTIKTTDTNPPRATRALAMVHTAVFDAVNARHQIYFSYHVTGRPHGNYSEDAAAAAAAHRVLVHLYPAQQSTFDAALEQSVQGIPNGLKRKGVKWGQLCADAIIALRANDGSSTVVPYSPPTGPGFWVPTPPGFLPALLPNWPTVEPWALISGDQFRGAGPPLLNSPDYTAAFDEVKELGSNNSATRTADETEIALFWADGAGTITPPGHWNVIAQDVAELEDNTLLDNARLFAMLNVAMADGAICCWDTKYFYSHWRPVTGIREANTDGNNDTDPDPSWTPLIVTPPFPGYTSGHSTFSGAAATVLAAFFGTDDIAFTTTSDGLPNVSRSFSSFSEASNEAAESRLFGGIHWRYDNADGLTAGIAIGEYVDENFFGPVDNEDDDDDGDDDDDDDD